MGDERSAASGPALRPGHRTSLWLAVGAAVAVGLMAVFTAFTVIPPVVVNLASEVSDAAAPYALESDGVAAAVAVPTGWVVLRESADVVRVRTPDGAWAYRLDLVDAPAAEVVGAAAQGDEPIRSELLDSGLLVVHTDVEDGGTVAAVQISDDGSVRVSASGPPASADLYRPALAVLLEGIGP